MEINVYCSLFCGTNAQIEIPVKDFSEVKQWYVKWDTFFYTLDNDKWQEIPLESGAPEIDWKRPDSTTVYDADMQEILCEDS